MPKIPYRAEKSREEDEDYEIVSFEDFCDKSPGSKTDLLTLNDNINYRLCYESDKSPNNAAKYGESSSKDAEIHTETSLNGSKNVTFKRKMSNSFAPFGRYNAKSGRAPLFSGVIPKARNEGEGSREHRYQRFSEQRNWIHRAWEQVSTAGPGMLGVALVCALCVGAWWVASGALGGAWGEEHYRKLWERAHPDNTKKPPTPITYEKILPEYRYHDHNNLSTKNKSNSTEFTRKKADLNKKSFVDRPPEVLKDICAKVEDNLRFDCFPQANANENDCVKRGCCWLQPEQKGKNIPYCYYPPQYDSFRFLNMTEDRHSASVYYERARPSGYPDDFEVARMDFKYMSDDVLQIKYHSFRFLNMTEDRHSASVYYERARPSGYPDDFEVARMDFKYMSDDVLQIKIYDAENKRFEPPVPEIAMVSKPIDNMKFRVEINGSAVGFKVIRNSDNVTIFNTEDMGGLILSDKFLQISAGLSTKYLFGLGERRAKFLIDMNWQTFALFNRDRVPMEHQNLYGTHPFFLAMDPQNHNSYGVLLLNSNAMDIVLQPTPAITYRAIGGVLNFFVFLGPSPMEVAGQYAALVGRPFMPPYWSLGFHLCKYNYLSLNTTRNVWKANRDAGIPFDVQWNDLDYMKDANDFTYDTVAYAGLPEFVDELHKDGMHYVMLLDPGISASEKPGSYPPYDKGIEMDVFIKNGTNQPFVGKVWNRESTVYPDFTHPNGTQFWVDMMTDFHKKVKYDGAWIDMNEPSNFVDGIKEGHCSDEELPYKPHTPDPYLRAHTLCMDAKQYSGPHYDMHNLYGLTEAIATNFALSDIRGKRPFIISRSTFVGSGKFTGHWSGDIASEWHDMRMTIPGGPSCVFCFRCKLAEMNRPALSDIRGKRPFIISRSTFVGSGKFTGHWSGDIASEWHDMRMTIPELLNFNLFAIPMMGADICGFRGNTTVELCRRWMQLGAFYPFSRNHNSDSSSPQDPVSLGPSVVSASRTALRLRYALLPYYYTLFFAAHVYGEPVIRPVFFVDPDNEDLYDIDDQFLIGAHVMVTPLLERGASTATPLFPGPLDWHHIRTGTSIGHGRKAVVDEDHTVTVRGGAIIPLQEPPARGPVTTTAARSGPLQLLAAPDRARQAEGQLYWDDGDSLNSYDEKKFSHIKFTLNRNILSSRVVWWGYGVPSINNITIFNQPTVVSVTVKGASAHFEYLEKTKVLQIYNINLSLDNPFEVQWLYKAKQNKAISINSPYVPKSG